MAPFLAFDGEQQMVKKLTKDQLNRLNIYQKPQMRTTFHLSAI